MHIAPGRKRINMKKFQYIFLILVLQLVSSCGELAKKMATEAAPVEALKQGIRVDIAADRQLNYFNNQSHTLVLVVYQLSTPDYFKQMAASPEGMGELLEAKPNEPSFVSKSKLVIQPGESRQVYIDRVKDANYVGILAGYFSDDIKGLTRLFSADLRDRNLFFWRRMDKDPADTHISVHLGAEKITQLVLNGKEKDKVM